MTHLGTTASQMHEPPFGTQVQEAWLLLTLQVAPVWQSSCPPAYWQERSQVAFWQVTLHVA